MTYETTRRAIAPPRIADNRIFSAVDAYMKVGTVERVTAEHIAYVCGLQVAAVQAALDSCVYQGRARREGEYYSPISEEELLPIE